MSNRKLVHKEHELLQKLERRHERRAGAAVIESRGASRKE